MSRSLLNLPLHSGGMDLVAVFSLLLVGWGSMIAAMSVQRGPTWVVRVLRPSQLLWLLATIFGLALSLVDGMLLPGLVLAYLAAFATWFTRSTFRNLTRVLMAGPYVAPPRRVRTAALRNAATLLAAAGSFSAAAGFWMASRAIALPWVGFALAIELGLAAVFIFWQSTKIAD